MEFDYGDPSRGKSFEDDNFRSALEAIGHTVFHYDFMAQKHLLGTRRMRRDLVSFASEIDVDVVFLVLFTNELDPKTLRQLSRATQAPTVNWFADDHWRFEGFSRRMAQNLDWSITTDPSALRKYRSHGLQNVLLSQWACNHHLYHPTDLPIARDVTFVGQPHGNRRSVVESLRQPGIPIECYGHGWPNGRVTTNEMISLFGTSAVNINLSNASRSSLPEVAYRRMLRLGGSFGPRPSQIKGRHFEIPGCGGFQLTEYVPHLEDYFGIGDEIAVYHDPLELPGAVRYWLDHPDERSKIARNGLSRILSEHTYDHRFAEIFGRILER